MYGFVEGDATVPIRFLKAPWLDRFSREHGPVYLAIVAALDAAIRAGELQPGDQLPPQRAVAERLGVDFTTVTRAYTVARERGLVEAVVGRGTFIKARITDDEIGLIDLGMNLPPAPQGGLLGRLLKETTAAILERTDAAALMAYHPGAGSTAQRGAAADWLAPCLGTLAPARTLTSPGAQTALAALLGACLARREVLVVEPLTYPGILSLAVHLGLRVVSSPVDAEGLLPEDLARTCRDHNARAVYFIPTLQNPTTTTMSVSRREAIARVCREADVLIFEDDAYGRLLQEPLPAVTSFAPERGFYVSTVSKTLSPGLRTAFVAVPDAVAAGRVGEAMRAISLMGAPLMTAVTTAWIRDGTANRLLDAVRAEARARHQIAREILPQAIGGADGVHLWLDLPALWDARRLRQIAQTRGVALVTAAAFTLSEPERQGLRISLGGPARRAVLAEALRGVADILSAGPGAPQMVV